MLVLHKTDLMKTHQYEKSLSVIRGEKLVRITISFSSFIIYFSIDGVFLCI